MSWIFSPQDLWVGVSLEPGHGSMRYRGGFRVRVMLLPTLGFCFDVYSEWLRRRWRER